MFQNTIPFIGTIDKIIICMFLYFKFKLLTLQEYTRRFQNSSHFIVPHYFFLKKLQTLQKIITVPKFINNVDIY
jgi:hypothetical protein